MTALVEIGRPILIRPHQVAALRRPRTEARGRRQDLAEEGLTRGPLQKLVVAHELPYVLLWVELGALGR
jgi:hypothetical protein